MLATRLERCAECGTTFGYSSGSYIISSRLLEFRFRTLRGSDCSSPKDSESRCGMQSLHQIWRPPGILANEVSSPNIGHWTLCPTLGSDEQSRNAQLPTTSLGPGFFTGAIIIQICTHPSGGSRFVERPIVFLDGESLRNVLFPLGEYLKTTTTTTTTVTTDSREDASSDATTPSVRQLAIQANLPNANKRESMGICFVGKRNHASFVQDYLEAPSGEHVGKCINVVDGSVVTTFDPQTQPSFLYATIGQGAKIGGASQRWFVVDKPDAFTLLLCPGTHHPALYADSFQVDQLHWISGVEPPLPIQAQCRIRHLQPLVDCEIRRVHHHQHHQHNNYQNGEWPPPQGSFEIVTAKPLRGIAPGQVCAIYVRDVICLGGGSITRRGPTYMDRKMELPHELHPAGRNDWSVRTPYRLSQVLHTTT